MATTAGEKAGRYLVHTEGMFEQKSYRPGVLGQSNQENERKRRGHPTSLKKLKPTHSWFIFSRVTNPKPIRKTLFQRFYFFNTTTMVLLTGKARLQESPD